MSILTGALKSISPVPGKSGWPWTEETDPALYKDGTDWPKISIVTPSFNQGQFIEETIRSILLQNYPNLEFIIIDGGSTDETVDIIKKYSPWITHWTSEKDRGQSDAINKGAALCTGEIFNWINSDDCLSRNALHTLATVFRDQSKLCCCGRALIHYTGSDKPESHFRTTLLDKNINDHLASVSYCQPGTFFRMSAYREITPLAEDLHMNMDMYMWFRFVCLYGMEKIAVTDEVLCTVKAHADAKTVKNFSKSFSDKQRIYDSLFTAVNPGFKHHGNLLPIKISPAVAATLQFKKLRKRYCRTHFFRVTMHGKITGMNTRLILEWMFS
jgi:glycosyltransferase involved in cell wall biosynthesis